MIEYGSFAARSLHVVSSSLGVFAGFIGLATSAIEINRARASQKKLNQDIQNLNALEDKADKKSNSPLGKVLSDIAELQRVKLENKRNNIRVSYLKNACIGARIPAKSKALDPS